MADVFKGVGEGEERGKRERGDYRGERVKGIRWGSGVGLIVFTSACAYTVCI